ncbi:hypothetical protein [Pseudotamlana carrageenivorans]|uniref:Uncharacterized protein n=1 Tax=Pseudotamlana carrageenivorans TaxID=2069432 RepID=A0A2I7SK63_9FLAO|nr:hypothetical protein [Tamlana carrageenivorans]AUS06254.1 hypothetical protein C1A40_12715 [Tamlana carrageenivorans]
MIKKFLNAILGDTNNNSKESFSMYEIEFAHPNLKTLSQNLNLENYSRLNRLISDYGCKWDLTVEDLSYSITQEKFEELKLEDYDDFENVTINFNIYKSKELIVIIDNEVFNSYLESIPLQRFLEIINTFDSSFIIENEQDNFEIKIEKGDNINISNQTNFKNSILYPYNPDTFYFNNINKQTKSILDDYFLKLSQVFCFAYLFNFLEIKGDSIDFSITGKSLSKILCF